VSYVKDRARESQCNNRYSSKERAVNHQWGIRQTRKYAMPHKLQNNRRVTKDSSPETQDRNSY